MAVTNYSLGQLNPVVYFINSAGEVALPPSTETAHQYRRAMEARGYELREARNLPEIDALQKHMEEFERAKILADHNRTERSLADARREVRDRLTSRMISSSTSAYERDFIREYLMVREEKREKHQKRFVADIAARFVQRDYDNPRNHYENVINAIPDGKDVECTRCHKFRRLDKFSLCFRCLYGLERAD